MSTEQRDLIERLMRSQPFDPTLPVDQQRAGFASAFEGRDLPSGSVARSAELAGRSGICIERTDSSSGSVLLYLHGGGFIAGSASTGQFIAAGVAQRAGLTAFVLDYRLAPEDPFPAASDDVLAAYQCLVDSGTDPGRIVIAGDSAGGGLTISLLVALAARGLPQPAAAVVFSPFVDLAITGSSATSHIDVDPLLTPAALELFATSYLGDADAVDPLASPLYADLGGLPPLLIQVGTHELLLDDALRLAQRAAHADVSVTLDVFPGMPHVFQSNEVILDEAGEALELAGTFIQRAIGSRGV